MDLRTALLKRIFVSWTSFKKSQLESWSFNGNTRVLVFLGYQSNAAVYNLLNMH
jgi:hypothetical protein